MSEMREHTTLTLLHAWHWAVEQKLLYGTDYQDYCKYVVCFEAQVAIEQELRRRDRRAWAAWMHAGILANLHPDKYFDPPEEAHYD